MADTGRFMRSALWVNRPYFPSCPKADILQIMSEDQPNNPLHGITLEQMIKSLVEHYGWDELGILINIRCFNSDPSVKSSLNFLRKTDWARQKVEELYIETQE